MAAGVSVDALMQRAGAAIAEQIRRLGAGAETLILCGPGNNGGDGYVAATILNAAGVTVRVAAMAEPATDASRRARAGWDGPVGPIAAATPAPVLVDALFGTGLSRPIDDAVSRRLVALAAQARLTIAIDLPSGIASDDGRVLSPVPPCDITLALGAAKPSHLLQPAARYMDVVRVIDIGVPVDSDTQALARPALSVPGPDAHKYTRGMVAIIVGEMAGAATLSGIAAMRAGAGYVALLGGTGTPGPHALVHRACTRKALADHRIGALLVGPGLGRGDEARERLDLALASEHPIVIDGDALHLLDAARLGDRTAPAILTPHAGEFAALFGAMSGGKLAATRAAARCGAVIVQKGADTVIAAPDGAARIAARASPWLSTAGTGDVLAGAVAAMLAGGRTAMEAASAGVWLHREAARRLGPAFIADDLADALSQVWKPQ